MRVNHADVFAVVLGLDKALHHFLALRAGKVAGLRANNLDIRRFGNRLGKPFLTIDSHARAHGALQLHDVTRLARDGFHQPVADKLAFQHVVGGNGGHVERLVFNINGTVEEDHRDLRVFRLFQHRLPAGRHHRRDENRVHALGDKRTHRFDLVLLLLLAIGDFQRNAALLRLAFRNAGFRRAPARFRADLRKSHG